MVPYENALIHLEFEFTFHRHFYIVFLHGILYSRARFVKAFILKRVQGQKPYGEILGTRLFVE
jgi:hypothetical protein